MPGPDIISPMILVKYISFELGFLFITAKCIDNIKSEPFLHSKIINISFMKSLDSADT